MNRINLTPEEKKRAIAGTMEQLTRQYGQRAVMFGNSPNLFLEAIPTGLKDLDDALGIGGLPCGRIVEIYGQPGAGKTSLALHLARQVPTALYIDADYGITPGIGAGLYLSHADTLEDALGICEMAAAGFDMIVVDTLSTLSTKAEQAAELGRFWQERNSATILSRALPRLSHSLAKHGCTLVLVTQLREKPGIVCGNPYFAIGGRALKHYASVRLEVQFVEKIEQDGAIIGQRDRIRPVKNKCGPQFSEVYAKMLF